MCGLIRVKVAFWAQTSQSMTGISDEDDVVLAFLLDLVACHPQSLGVGQAAAACQLELVVVPGQRNTRCSGSNTERAHRARLARPGDPPTASGACW